MAGTWRPLACALAGVLGFLGYVGFDLYPLGWVFLVPLLRAVRDVTPRRALLLGWLTGGVGHMGGFHWFVYTMREFVGFPLLPALLGLLGIAALNGFSVGIAAYLARRLHRDRRVPLGLGMALSWVVVEHLYPMLFPMVLGAGQYRLLPLLQIADVTGPLGVSFLVAFGNGVLFEWIFRGPGGAPRRITAAFAALLLLCAGYGYLRMAAVDRLVATAPTVRVALVQTNIASKEAFADRPAYLAAHQEMSREADADPEVDLILWPENVVTLSLDRGATHVGAGLRAGLRKPLLLGTAIRGANEATGSMLLVGDDEEILGRYDKRRLIPFGEYVPFASLLPFLDGISDHQGHYSPGTSLEPILLRGYRLSPSVCYEAIFPRVVREAMNAGDPPHAMVNATNDSWYGDSIEGMQHLVLASLRAIEHRRALVRATNTGISAIIDPCGRIDRRTRQREATVLKGDLPLLAPETPYAALDWFPAAALGALVLLFLRRRG